MVISDRLSQAFHAADLEARQLGKQHIDSVSLTLGVIQEATSDAGQLLISHGLKPEILRNQARNFPNPTNLLNLELRGLKCKLSPAVNDALSRAEQKKNEFKAEQVTPEMAIVCLIEVDQLYIVALKKAGLSEESLKCLKSDLVQSITGEESESCKDGSCSTAGGGGLFNLKRSILADMTIDLTKLAKEQKLSPVVGRLFEITRAIQILLRKTKCNPVLIGEPGVGKTAIAEGIAQRIANGNVPKRLKGKRILQLDMATMVAGCCGRGQFEERMVALVKEVKKVGDVILFIDELHTLVGAGGSPGGVDAGNSLKNALAKGEVSIIGATTLDEYRKLIEKADKALARRFRVVNVPPPSVPETIQILEGLRPSYEKFHNVTYPRESLEAAAELSQRYIGDRFQPDKSIDLIDEAGSKMEMDHDKRDSTLPPLPVTRDMIAQIVSAWTGIPVTDINEDEKERLLKLESHLHRRVISQNRAIASVARAIRRGRAGMKDPKRPTGFFLFLGPTGVGKTELAKALQEFLTGKEDGIIRLDMSEYMEKHTVSAMLGAPAGYIGYEDGGNLTEKVRRAPYSVVLLDEIEKAHPDIFNVLLQIGEDGKLTDRQGRECDFRNTIIVMTSNIGSEKLLMVTGDDTDEVIYDEVNRDVRRVFKPEFINRLDEIIFFHQLNKEDVEQIYDLMLVSIKDRVPAGTTLEIDEDARLLVLEKGFNQQYGARPMRRALQRYVEDPTSEEILTIEDKEKEHGGKFVVHLKEGTTETEFVANQPKSDKSEAGASELSAPGPVLSTTGDQASTAKSASSLKSKK